MLRAIAQSLGTNATLFGTIAIAIGAEALGNTITREVHKKGGFRPALLMGSAFTILGAAAVYYGTRPRKEGLGALL